MGGLPLYIVTDRMYGQMVSPGNDQVGRDADTLGG
jgi:hypothetical protein